MADSTIALLILGAVIALFTLNRLPVGVVAIGTALSLWATGLLDINEALGGFGDPVVIFIATLFVVADAIELSGLTTWAGNRLLALAGDGGANRVLVALMLLCAVLTAMISLNGSVAALMSVAVLAATRLDEPPSRFLMPMAFAGSAGSLLVLIGTPVNVIMSDASFEAGLGRFGFFEFAVLGIPILVVTVAITVLISDKVLPERHPATAPPDLSHHAAVLADHYAVTDGVHQLRVRSGSSLIGTSADELDLEGWSGLTLIAVQSVGETSPPIGGAISVDDVVVVAGPSEAVGEFAVNQHLAIAMEPVLGLSHERLISRDAGVAEVVVPPRSPLIGEVVFPGMRRSDGLVVLAIQRLGQDLGQRSVEIESGDCLLLFGTWPDLDDLVTDRDVLVVDSPDLVKRQAAPLGRRAAKTSVIVVAMVALLAFGLVPPAVAGLIAALGLVLTKVLTSAQVYRAVSWETVVLVGGLIPLSTAIQTSGAGERIADGLLRIIGGRSPIVLMIALFVLTSVLGLVISNTATALIVLPIATSAAHEYGVSLRPVLMLLAVACSAALLTPVQTPGNMMIMAPAGYRFGDYWKLGLPLAVAWLAVSLVIVPAVWPL